MKSWILANLFIFFLVGIGAGIFWVAFSIVQSLNLSPGVERLGALLAALAAIFGTYFTGKALHSFLR